MVEVEYCGWVEDIMGESGEDGDRGKGCQEDMEEHNEAVCRNLVQFLWYLPLEDGR